MIWPHVLPVQEFEIFQMLMAAAAEKSKLVNEECVLRLL